MHTILRIADTYWNQVMKLTIIYYHEYCFFISFFIVSQVHFCAIKLSTANILYTDRHKKRLTSRLTLNFK
jgi:hypothetical protein